MPAFPTRRRLSLAALLLAALVALPGPNARSWADEAPASDAAAVEVTTASAAADLATDAKVEVKVEETTATAPVEVKVETEAKVAETAKAEVKAEVEVEEAAKPAPVVVDDSSDEFTAGKDKAASKKDEPKAEAKQDEVDCSNPLVNKGTLTHGNPATWTFTVKDGCSFTGGLDSWKLPVPRFVTEQTHVDREAGTYGAGTHTLTVDRAKCWQLDGYKGTQPAGSIWYEGRLLVTHIGGTEPCIEQPVPPVDEEETPVKETPVVKKTPVAPTKRPVKAPKRIVVKKQAPAPAKKKAPVLPKHPELTGGTLPFTGPRDLLLPAGLGMLTIGLALVLASRRREAQLDIASRAVARALRKPYRGPRETL